MTVLDINEIRAILPHRYPFLLVDRIVELEADRVPAYTMLSDISGQSACMARIGCPPSVGRDSRLPLKGNSPVWVFSSERRTFSMSDHCALATTLQADWQMPNTTAITNSRLYFPVSSWRGLKYTARKAPASASGTLAFIVRATMCSSRLVNSGWIRMKAGITNEQATASPTSTLSVFL